MGKSTARKKREHILRNSGRDVTKSRGMVYGFSTHERKTKTKHDKIKTMEKKHKKRFLHQQNQQDEGTFLLSKETCNRNSLDLLLNLNFIH
ncbi:hypothetical protein [Evansella halocellulosilytica]|uniref:hypothetical protein n=1 Tax=Evansella halocellulosilytica TaxID=2011013 RepID=UPI000BB7698A|nr:hypothetical protein [Evansella halocellulosilytica]